MAKSKKCEKKNLVCWSRKTKTNKRYVACACKTRKKSIKKKKCSEFEDSYYDTKTKKLMVCVNKSGKFVTYEKYQTILLKELTKVLNDDIKYISEDKKDKFKAFSEKYKKKYVTHYTKKKYNKFEPYMPGELSRMMIEDFDYGAARFN